MASGLDFCERLAPKIAITGGAPVRLATAPIPRGGSWADDRTIVFAPTISDGLWRVSAEAAGGKKAERLTTLAPGEWTHRWPQVLPGGRAVLYAVTAEQGNFTRVLIAVQPLPTSPSHVVQRDALHGRYLPSGHSYLGPRRDALCGALLFQDPRRHRAGRAGVRKGRRAAFLVATRRRRSDTGTPWYVPGIDTATAVPLNWLMRDGKNHAAQHSSRHRAGVRIAPNSRRLAFTLYRRGEHGRGGSTVWSVAS